MSRTASLRVRTPRAFPRAVLTLVVVSLVIVAVAVFLAASPATPLTGTASQQQSDAAAEADGVVNVDDGLLTGDVTAFDDTHPGVARLAPALLAALRAAAEDALRDGVVIHVNSGWRSAEYQDQLLQDAVAQYGSIAEAARWVASATTSAHVAGDAVDVGSFDAVAWMSSHGGSYGLCQTYANESWHFELRPEAIGQGCPAPYADPTQDPRMRG